MKISIFIILFFLATLNIFGQTLREYGTFPDGKTAVWIYAGKSTVDFRKQDYPILLDGIEIAMTHPGRFFIAAVSPGKHSFQIGKSKQQKFEMEFKTKQIYYLRINQEKSKNRQTKDFEIQSSDDMRRETDLKMINDRDVKNKQIAINKQEG